MIKQRKATMYGLVASLFVLSSLAAAWACTPAATSFQIIPSIGKPGVKVTATGQNFAAPVEIHWNSAEGVLVGAGQGGNPTVEFAVPADAAPGVYYVVAIQRNKAGEPVSKISSSFEVTASTTGKASNAAAAIPAQDLWSGFSAGSPNLGAAPESAAADAGTSPGLMAGMVLAASGTASLLTLTVVGLRKRRSTAKLN